MIWGFVTSIASAAVSAVSSTVSAIGSAISSGLSTIVATISTSIGSLASGVGQVLGGFVKGLLDALGVTHPKEPVEDFGDRILQAREHGIKLETSEEFEAYMEKLRSFEPDPEKSKSYSPQEKLSAAMTIGAVAIGHKFDLDQEDAAKVWLLPLAAPAFFNPERVLRVATEGRLLDVLDYLEGKLTPDEGLALARQLYASEQRLNPASEMDALRRELREAREVFVELNRDPEQTLRALDERLKASPIPHDGMPLNEAIERANNNNKE